MKTVQGVQIPVFALIKTFRILRSRGLRGSLLQRHSISLCSYEFLSYVEFLFSFTLTLDLCI